MPEDLNLQPQNGLIQFFTSLMADIPSTLSHSVASEVLSTHTHTHACARARMHVRAHGGNLTARIFMK